MTDRLFIVWEEGNADVYTELTEVWASGSDLSNVEVLDRVGWADDLLLKGEL